MTLSKPLTPQELADLEGCHVETIREHIRSGRLIARKVGASYSIDQHRIEEWRKAMETKPQRASVRTVTAAEAEGFRRSKFKPRLIDGGGDAA